IVNRVKYGAAHLEDKLGAADYNLVARGPHDLFSFCMCAGGHIIPSVSEEGYFCTNGMSLSDRASPFANSGLVVTVPLEHFPGPEARGSGPIRMLRDTSTREAPGLPGLYPVGEGAGYAGGIVSAAVDGLRSALAVIAKYARLAV